MNHYFWITDRRAVALTSLQNPARLASFTACNHTTCLDAESDTANHGSQSMCWAVLRHISRVWYVVLGHLRGIQRTAGQSTTSVSDHSATTPRGERTVGGVKSETVSSERRKTQAVRNQVNQLARSENYYQGERTDQEPFMIQILGHICNSGLVSLIGHGYKCVVVVCGRSSLRQVGRYGCGGFVCAAETEQQHKQTNHLVMSSRTVPISRISHLQGRQNGEA